MLKGVNKWEKMDKNTHFIKGMESNSAANDSTTAISLIIPNIKIDIKNNQTVTGKSKYTLVCEKASEFYLKPYPFTNKIYRSDSGAPNTTRQVGLLGSGSANKTTELLNNVNIKDQPFFGYFLDRERYFGNFLVTKDAVDKILIVDKDLKVFHSIEDLVNYRYGSIENLLILIKQSENKKQNVTLFIVDNIISSANQVSLIATKEIASIDVISPYAVNAKIYKDRWLYDQIAIIKTKQKAKD